MIDFLCQTEFLLLNLLKLLKVPGFLYKTSDFFSSFFFCLNYQIQGFSRYSGNPAINKILLLDSSYTNIIHLAKNNNFIYFSCILLKKFFYN